MSIKVKFECPACKNERFEEVMHHCIVASECWLEDGELQYGDQVTTYGEVAHYQCAECGDRLKLADGVDRDGNPVYTDVESDDELRQYFGIE